MKTSDTRERYMKSHLNFNVSSMKKIILPTVVLFMLFLTGCTTSKPLLDNKKTVSLDENWREAQSPYSDSVVCTLKISTVTDFEEDHIKGKVNIDEKPTTLTFVDINTENPSMVGNLGGKAPLTKIANGSTVYLVEMTDFGNLNVFTLFRDKNIMLMSKQYNLLGKPFGLMMIGDCLSGV